MKKALAALFGGILMFAGIVACEVEDQHEDPIVNEEPVEPEGDDLDDDF